MAKLSKDELKEKINACEISEELKVSLLEDIEDSVEVVEEKQPEVNEYEIKYNNLLEKYKTRFLEKNVIEDTPEEKIPEEQQIQEIVDVKEIF